MAQSKSWNLTETLTPYLEDAATRTIGDAAEIFDKYIKESGEICDVEVALENWPCVMPVEVPVPGRLYITPSFICFWGQFLSRIERKIIALSSIASISMGPLMYIRIQYVPKDEKAATSLTVGNFLNPNATFSTIVEHWRQRCHRVIARNSLHWLQVSRSPNEVEDEFPLDVAIPTAQQNDSSGGLQRTASAEEKVEELRKHNLNVLQQMLDSLIGKRHWTNRSVDLGSFLILRNQQRKRMVNVPNKPVTDDVQTYEELHRAMVYARAAYGVPMFFDYMSTVSGFVLLNSVRRDLITASDEETARAIQLMTGLKRENILHIDYQMKLFAPCHFLAIDFEKQWVAVCVRGTVDDADLLSDACAECVDIGPDGGGGRAHRGMAIAAQKLLRTLRPIIISALNEHPTFSLVLIGHSLGAGVASLISYLLRLDPVLALPSPHQEKIKCFAFGCPAIVSPNISEQCYPFVTTVACGKDIIPRASLFSAHKLVGDLSEVSAIGFIKNAWNKIQPKLAPASPSTKDTNAENTLPEENGEENGAGSAAVDDVIELTVPPGRVLLIRKPLTQVVTLVESDPQNFTEIPVRSTAFTDHMPDAYLLSLRQLFDNISSRPVGSDAADVEIIEDNASDVADDELMAAAAAAGGEESIDSTVPRVEQPNCVLQ